jgi:superfamily II DNA or RNA helicase
MTNMYGEVINLLMISSSGAEGIDLKNVRYVHITEPYWHPVRIDQVIGRAKRICSHKDLPEEQQNVTVFMYLLSYNKKLLKEKETLYTQLINVDTDDDGSVITTDEKLLRIMKRKKKLMQHFLTAMKEASIDCVFNHEEKEKCLTFPLPKTGINPHKTLQTNLQYKDDPYENVKVQKPKDLTNADNERGEYIDKKEKSVVLKTKYVKVDGKGGMKKKVGVDFTQTPPVAFDLKDKTRLGLLEKMKNDNYLLKLDT